MKAVKEIGLALAKKYPECSLVEISHSGLTSSIFIATNNQTGQLSVVKVVAFYPADMKTSLGHFSHVFNFQKGLSYFLKNHSGSDGFGGAYNICVPEVYNTGVLDVCGSQLPFIEMEHLGSVSADRYMKKIEETGVGIKTLSGLNQELHGRLMARQNNLISGFCAYLRDIPDKQLKLMNAEQKECLEKSKAAVDFFETNVGDQLDMVHVEQMPLPDDLLYAKKMVESDKAYLKKTNTKREVMNIDMNVGNFMYYNAKWYAIDPDMIGLYNISSAFGPRMNDDQSSFTKRMLAFVKEDRQGAPAEDYVNAPNARARRLLCSQANKFVLEKKTPENNNLLKRTAEFADKFDAKKFKEEYFRKKSC